MPRSRSGPIGRKEQIAQRFLARSDGGDTIGIHEAVGDVLSRPEPKRRSANTIHDGIELTPPWPHARSAPTTRGAGIDLDSARAQALDRRGEIDYNKQRIS
jgi:hypothetical protein